MEKLPPMLQKLMLMLDAGLAAVAMADEVPHSFSKSARRRRLAVLMDWGSEVAMGYIQRFCRVPLLHG